MWNTGIFMGKVSVFIKNFQTYWQDLWNTFEQVLVGEGGTPALLARLYQTLLHESFDNNVLEKAKHAFVLQAEFG